VAIRALASGHSVLVAAPTVPQPTAATVAQAPSIDQQFIDMRVPYDEGALGMAQIAQQRAERPELRQSIAIMEAEQREIGQMRARRLSWSQTGASATPAAKPATETDKPSHIVPGEDMNH